MTRGWVGRAMTSLVCLACIPAHGWSQSSDRGQHVRAAERQPAFLSIIDRTRAVYPTAPHEMAKSAMRQRRAVLLCNLLSRGEIDGWTGIVSALARDSHGRTMLSVEIGDRVHLKTWNDASSDGSDRTLIQPGSSLHQQTLDLDVGRKVSISGSFIRNRTDCVRESSPSMDGSMTEPQFIFRFQTISPADDSVTR